MDISLISKYRTQLMGIAILWVMFFHSPIHIPDSLGILNQIKQMGYGGVDIFMFLSGIGIFFSLSKNSSIKIFYKRRFLRIIPYYTPIVLLYSITLYYHGIISLSTIYLNVLTISFWINQAGLFDWYIPSILFFYLISPVLVYLIKKNYNILLVSILLLSFFLYYILAGTRYCYLLPVVGRFPIFLFGLYLGRQLILKEKLHYSKYWIIPFVILFVTGCIFWKYIFIYTWPRYWSSCGIGIIPFWVLTFPLCALISIFLSLLKNYKYPILTFMGTNTLIFYIFHERIMNLLFYYDVKDIALLGFVLTIPIGFAWKNIVGKVMDFLQKKRKTP